MKMSFKSMEPTFAIKVSLKKTLEFNADRSSDNNNANVNPRAQQTNQTVIYVDDDDSNADLLDEDEEICPICQDRLGEEIELGKMICSCTARFHYQCLVQYTRCDPEFNPFLNDRIKCVTCNGIAAGIERITRNRHGDDDSNADLSDEDEEICPICQDRLGTGIELGKMICSCTARFHYISLVQYTRRDP
jgi:RNA polymerase subunit RPABC4/transcription elongation factor Spt4